MTAVYVQDTNYTGLSNLKKDASHVQMCHLYSANYKTKYIPYSSDDNKSRSLQKANALYGCTPCRQTRTATVEPTQVISPLS